VWNYKIITLDENTLILPVKVGGHPLMKFGVTAVDRVGTQSEFEEKLIDFIKI